MTFRLVDADQRSDEWRLVRCGRLTGSRACDMLATIKSGEAAARRDLRLQLVCERLTESPQDSLFINADMQRGIDKEPDAIAAYEALTGDLIRASGFLAHNEYMAGCSLDGHVGNFDGIVELKCPKSATHIRYLRGGAMPTDYLPQVLHNLWITGAAWCDFLSFDDRFPVGLQVFRVRVTRDQAAIDEYEKKALAFLAEVDRDTEALITEYNLSAALAASVTA